MKGTRLLATAAIAGAVMVGASALPARAGVANPHFASASAKQDANHNLVVSFHEAGLDGTYVVTMTLSANASAVWGCINGGGNHPQAANKETVNSAVSNTQNFPVDKNGNVVGSLSVSPPGPGNFTCPPGQNLRLLSASYTNIVLHDLTTGVTANLGSA